MSTGFDFDDVRRVPIDYHPESENEYREEFHPWGVFLGGKVELRVARRTHFSGAVRGRWAVGSARGRYRNTWWAWDWGRAGDEQTRYGPTLREVRLHSYDGGGRESLWMLAADVQLTWAATEWLELGGGWRWRDWGSEWQPGVIHGPFASLSMRF